MVLFFHLKLHIESGVAQWLERGTEMNAGLYAFGGGKTAHKWTGPVTRG